MNKCIFLMLSSLLILSCNTDDSKNTHSVNDLDCLPNYSFDFDADNDGINDFRIYCYKDIYGVLIGPHDGLMLIGIELYQNTNILTNSENGIFFLEQGDIITSKENKDNEYWSNEFGLVMSKAYYKETGWNEEWSVNSNLQEYYLAFKLQNGATEKIGWIKLDINTSNTEVQVVDKNNTELNFIVIK